METADGVAEDGRPVVRGAALPRTGRVPVQAGEPVAVAWRDGRPEVVMMNEGNRTGASAILAEVGASAVEELFIATDPSTGQLDVWYRNFDQITPLRLGSQLGGGIAASAISTVKWGPLGDRFIVQTMTVTFFPFTFHPAYHVFKFGRAPQRNFAAGVSAADRVSLESFVNPELNATAVATIHPAGGPELVYTPASRTLLVSGSGGGGFGDGVSSCGASSIDYFLDDRGHLVLQMRVAATIRGRTTTAGLPVGETTRNVDVSYGWDVLVDAADNVILFSDEGGAHLGLGGGTLINAIPFGHIPFDYGHVGNCFAGLQEDNQQQYSLRPLLILSGVVKGFIAGTQRGRSTFQWTGSPGACSGEADRYAYGAQGPRKTAPLVMSPLATGSRGIAFRSSLDHLIWYESNAGNAGIGDWGAGVPITPMKVLDFASDLSAEVGAAQPYLDQDLWALFTDFVYRSDRQSVPLPAGAKPNVFIRAWPFGSGPATLNSAAGFTADQTMSEQAALKGLPAGVAPSAGTTVIRCINDRDVLPRFEGYPVP